MVTGEREFPLETLSLSLSLSLSLAAGAQLGFGFELSSPIDFFAISSLLFVDFQRIEIMRRIWRMLMLVGSLPDVVVKVVAPVSKRFSSFGKQIENPEFAPVKDLLLDL
jgi:hypothetical protein